VLTGDTEGAIGRRRRVLPAALALAALIGIAAVPSSHADAAATRGWILHQHQRNATVALTVASTGQKTVEVARIGRQTVRTTTIVDFRTRHVYLVDQAHRSYSDASMLGSSARLRAEEALMARSRPSIEPPKGALLNPAAKATVRPLPGTTKIAGLPATGFLVRVTPLQERVWVATTLPRMPAALMAQLARGGSADVARAAVLRASRGRVVLRIQELAGRVWHPFLDTTSVQRTRVSASTFAAPRHYKASTLAVTTRAPADVPANVGRITPFAPALGHPHVYALYWGREFASNPSWVFAMNAKLRQIVQGGYLSAASQYDSGPGTFDGSATIDADPFPGVGGANFAVVDGFIYGQRFATSEPKYWPFVGGYDPVIAVFVPASAVDSAAWGGYHFWAPIWDAFLCPVCHPIMPWLIVRVRDGSGLNAAVDNTTEDFSHELVEAATDPFPFFAWLDPLKFPPWEKAEVADICSRNSAPWGSVTRFEHVIVSTYWSNRDNACVPNSRPVVHITSPVNGSTVHWGPSLPLLATAVDPIDGPIPAGQIQWSEGSRPLVPDGSHMIPTFTPGRHTITASVTDSQLVTGSESTTFDVVAGTLAVTIAAPTDGQTFQVGQQISFSGSGRDSGLGDLPASDLSWDLGDGARVAGTGFTHAYASPGQKTVTLTGVAGPDTGSATIHITIAAAAPSGPPTVSITRPSQNQNFPYGGTQPIAFGADARTGDGSTISGSRVCWSDDVDGSLGCGNPLNRTLSDGDSSPRTHHVTVTATDHGQQAHASVTITSGVYG
jgi:hypothetical protein